MQEVKQFAIYPAIGIARVGNSDEYLLASETFGHPTQPDDGIFKDKLGRIKKQVPRFRIYALDANENVIREITGDDAEIEWTVHVANRKAAWYQFNNALDLGQYAIPCLPRNGGIFGGDRKKIVIDPGPRSISGGMQSGAPYRLSGGTYMQKEVTLGELRTDHKGRLLFFGGEGKSESISGAPAITFANNDGWYDDICDGTVRAKIKFDNKEYEAIPSVVVSAPPNYAPGLFPVVSMYDVVYDLYVEKTNWAKFPQPIIFYEHIYPILTRLTNAQWVNQGFFMLFGKSSPFDFSDPSLIQRLSDPTSTANELRQTVFDLFRNTASSLYQPDLMPPYYGDLFGDYENLAGVDLCVTRTQYKLLQHWANGNFICGIPDANRKAFDQLTPEEQVRSLLRAPLEECLGGPFHPGIEITWPFRNLIVWERPWRLKVLQSNEVMDDFGPVLTSAIALSPGGPLDGAGPGTITRWLGVPWQTDEASCLSGYDLPAMYLPLPSFWAVRVPNHVLTLNSFSQLTNPTSVGQKLKHFSFRADWLRDFGSSYVGKINAMVARWHELGVVAPIRLPNSDPWLPDEYWVEQQRVQPTFDPSIKQTQKVEGVEEDAATFVRTTLAESEIPTITRNATSLRRHER